MSPAARVRAVLPAALSLLLTLLVGLLVASPSRADAKAPDCDGVVDAPSAIVMEVSTATVVCADAPDRRLPVASTTKLMTALLTLERAKLSTTFTASSYQPAPVESQIGLQPGERMRVADLLRALLLESANDAAMALAGGVSGSERAFVRAMNARAEALGLRNTHYANPVGLDDPGNYSSARDLVLLATVLRTNRFFKRVVDSPATTLRSGVRPRTFENRNDLVRRYPWVNGVKTGHTRGAGYVLVGSAERHGVQVVSAVLGTPSEAIRDRDTLALLRHGLRRFRRERAVVAGRALAAVPVRGTDGGRLKLLATRTVRRVVPVRRPRAVQLRVLAPRTVAGPIRRGRRLGRVEVRQGGRLVATVPLVASRRVPPPPSPRSALSWLVPLVVLLAVAAIAGSVVATRRRRALRLEARHREAPAA